MFTRHMTGRFPQAKRPLRGRYAAEPGVMSHTVPQGFRKMKFAVTLFFLAALAVLPMQARADAQKRIVGATEVVLVTDANLAFKARVDTGAKTSSIHAEKIELDSSGDPRGKPISFYLVTKEGLSRKVETRVISVVSVRTAEHSERRYVVPLLITWNGQARIVSVTLNDRTSMDYRLLLGRNWLRGQYIVDVDKNSED
jgi:hypothetical protein